MQILWGDVHNHCGITYGYGALEYALKAAKQQLDFCSITGHAMWDDIPERTPKLEFLVDYHKNGFAKLKKNWTQIKNKIKEANSEDFVTFQGYEMHSSYYGDHHILSADDDLPLIDSASPRELIENVKPSKAIVIPHHIGYTPGYRGINWNEFDHSISPVVEVFSKHGCSMSDRAAYEFLHTMGPRDGRNTIFTGLAMGKKFGFIASTDHHAGYPGSYGDGRMAVWAESKTREAIFDAMVKRRTYAVTGDKIKCNFMINGAFMGSEITGENREIYFDVEACDEIDRIIIYKNLIPFKIYNFPVSAIKSNRYKIRIELGWGKNVTGYAWECKTLIENGKIIDAEPCFRGRSVLSPSEKMSDNDGINDINNRILSMTDNELDFVCNTTKNPSTLHSTTSAVNLTVEGDLSTILHINVNGKKIELSIAELLKTSYSAHVDSYNSEACLVHRAIPENRYHIRGFEYDRGLGSDFYHMEVRQCNNQYAWISPIFVNAE